MFKPRVVLLTTYQYTFPKSIYFQTLFTTALNYHYSSTHYVTTTAGCFRKNWFIEAGGASTKGGPRERVRKSRSGDGSTIAAPRPASLTAGSTVSRKRGAMEGPTPSRPQIAESALADDGQHLADDGQQWADDGLQPADDSMDSDNGEYEDNDGQSEVSEEEEDNQNGENDENVLEPGADDQDLSADWGAPRPVENEFLRSQPSITTITHGNSQTSGGRASYQERRTPAPIGVSQNRTPAFLPQLPVALNPLATPVLTQTQSDPTMREFDDRS